MGEEKYIGHIKYEDVLIEDGLMDARAQARALFGFDSALRYLIVNKWGLIPYISEMRGLVTQSAMERQLKAATLCHALCKLF